MTVGKRELWLVISIGCVDPDHRRITRASTLTWSDREFVLAAAAGRQEPAHHRARRAAHVLPAMFSIALLA